MHVVANDQFVFILFVRSSCSLYSFFFEYGISAFFLSNSYACCIHIPSTCSTVRPDIDLLAAL